MSPPPTQAFLAKMGNRFEPLLQFVVDRPAASLDELERHLEKTDADRTAEQEQSFENFARDKLKLRRGMRQPQ